MVNSYISHKVACKLTNTPAMKRGEWYAVLHSQLLQLKEQDFVGVATTPSPGSKKRRRKRVGHSLIQFDDWVTVSGIQKRRQRSCKTTPSATYAQKQDVSTECGLAIPPTLGKRVVLRRPGKKTGVRKKTRRELLREEACEADDELRGNADERSEDENEFDL
ncbi:hypothetical protein F442_15120 [Phytophthora nicotianae P10297]|uniref:Uncharacterized protein n=1 Tax=Phytophthora nicotianae P10297 TaxID=1317064 RepID=W2YQB5_PHYNI|nr:hypothetical protein F442_15120 [Phytophthora nicotianae P10297]